jgi:hypothetical protein
MTADNNAWDTRHQQNLLEFADALGELDAAMLAQLDPADRARQTRARQALWQYADAMWDAVKATAPEGTPATRNPYNSVAALRDLAMELWSAAQQAQASAGDPDDVADDVTMWAQETTPTGLQSQRAFFYALCRYADFMARGFWAGSPTDGASMRSAAIKGLPV